MRYFKDSRYQTFTIPTQIQNFAVQKVWVREGLKLTAASDTYHVNAFLNCGPKHKVDALSETDLNMSISNYLAKNFPGSSIQNSSMVALRAEFSKKNLEVSYRVFDLTHKKNSKLLITNFFSEDKASAIFYHTLAI